MKLPRNPLLVVGISIPLGLLIAALGIFPWSFLAQLNARFWAGTPWCVPLGLGWLALFLAYLNGRGWPRASAPTRKQLLRARPVHGPTLIWACIAGATGLVTLVTLYFVAIQFVNLPPSAFRPRSVGMVSTFVIVPIMLTNAIVAGVAEEAAYRGYMQGMLERRFNRAVAVGLVTVVFTGLHLLGGAKFFPIGHSSVRSQYRPWGANRKHWLDYSGNRCARPDRCSHPAVRVGPSRTVPDRTLPSDWDGPIAYYGRGDCYRWLLRNSRGALAIA